MEKENTKIKIGTVLKASDKTLDYIDRFIPAGIESVQLYIWGRVSEGIDTSWAERVAEGCATRGLDISAFAFFSNPLAGGEEGSEAKDGWVQVIELAKAAGVRLISGFTGRIPGVPVEESIEPVVEFFDPLLNYCEKYDISLAFENCPMNGNWHSGSWNIAFCPEIWDILLNDKLKSEKLGLEFDPSHCIGYRQPAMQLFNEWFRKILHIHGKDAVVLSESEACDGWLGRLFPYVEKFPGNGSFNWAQAFKKMKASSYEGTLDIEGYHTKFISHEAEFLNQKESISFLKKCRF